MFLAAALLMFGLPQSAPGASADSATTPAKTEMVKEAAAPSSALPVARMPKVAADDAVPATGESSPRSAEPFLPGAGIQPATPPKAAIRGVRYEAPKQKLGWIGLSAAGAGGAGGDAVFPPRGDSWGGGAA